MGPSFTSNIDLAQVVLYVFWAFFAGLIFYLHRENKREGYPLFSDRTNARVSVEGFPGVPAPKTYLLHNGDTVTVPNPSRDDRRPIAAVPVGRWPGAPLVPTGNPMLDGVGPGAYAERADVPDMTYEGIPKIVPLRAASAFGYLTEGPDLTGWKVVGGDGEHAGTVIDSWVDQSEYVFRYHELTTTAGVTVLVPTNFCVVDTKAKTLHVDAIFAKHFADVPKTKSPNVITLLEEEKIMGYYGGGTLYAEPKRAEPLL
jgi:photosynthetic reaction center H subunit